MSGTPTPARWTLQNGWTGGQYSVYRGILGLYLLVHFVQLAPWAPELFSNRGVLPDAWVSPLIGVFPNVLAWFDSPGFATATVATGALCSALFAAGYRDRWAAVVLWYIWACLVGRNPLILNPGIPYVGWLLLAHACLPRAPYGSWDARHRADPAGGWRMPGGIYTVAWVLMALGYSFSGWTKLASPSWVDGSALRHVLENPLARPGPIRDLALSLPDGLLRFGTWAGLGLELGFAPLALSRRARPFVWSALLVMHFSLMLLIDFVDLSLGLVLLHLFAFDPAWIRPADADGDEVVFYDGSCGLCHAAVRAVLAEDRNGSAFRFAPLGGTRFRALLPEAERERLPDSLVVVRPGVASLTRSRAVVRVGKRLGGIWRLVATVVAWVPASIADRAYDGIAAVRYRLFRRPADACPIVPANLRSRFDD